MTPSITEWEFTANVASWINQIIQVSRDLPFSEARCEQKSEGSLKRRDLTLLDSNRKVVLTGEVKLPYRKDGGSPYNENVVQDARQKAIRAKTVYFFTWNVNECVLWETFSDKTARIDRNYTSWDVTHVIREHQLTIPATEHAIKKWLPVLLNDFSKIIHGTAQFGRQTPDQKFVEALESALKMPIQHTLEALTSRYERRFKANLDAWMRDEMGWIISDDPEEMQDNMERAAKFACYALLNKLVFYEALLKRYGSRLASLNVPYHIDTGDNLRLHLEGYFSTAKQATGDYETIFGFTHDDIGNRIPFYSDSAVPYWSELIASIHHFDFSKLDYEVIGGIFERLISPDERHKYGQFYTSPEVVDLINSFCIRDGSEVVMDPACGGGTFLVRAYARKRELVPNQPHSRLLTDLYGVDISHFATHLTTINLATRDLIDEENYPRITRSDFFNVRQANPFITLPAAPKGATAKTTGMGTGQQRDIIIPPLDAVIGNPPYVRQEDIRKAKNNKQPEPGSKEFYQRLVKEEWPGLNLSGRSDLHCYFWPHAATFLKENGYLCLLTSSQWLDVEYGFRLQAWILNNFEIIAIVESSEEPWFVGARVVTTATILKRQKVETHRDINLVRFIQLHKPMKELLANDGTTAGTFAAANDLRDEILAQTANTLSSRYRFRIMNQGELRDEGVRLGEVMGESENYYGGKWGLYLRAPDLWFDLIERCGDRFSPLGEIAKIRRGITSGKDSFFYPKDFSRDALAKYADSYAFASAYGVPRQEVESGQVALVLCGEGRGEVHPIERKFLEPEIHSLMEIDGFTVAPADCSRMVILINQKKKSLKGTYALRFIDWGESNNIHKGSTCAARATVDREWYDLTGHNRGALFWPMAQQYKHAIPTNDHNLIANHNLFDILPKEGNASLLAGILNSSLVVLSKHQYGRPVGVEGNLKTEVIDVNMMLVPDTRQATKKQIERVTSAFEKLKQRKSLAFLSERRLREMSYRQKGKEAELAQLSGECELDKTDRRELDDAVLELLGISDRKERKDLLDRLYRHLSEFYEWTRQKEEKAIANKLTTSRRGKTRPGDIAEQIMTEIEEKEQQWLKHYEPHFLDTSKPFDTYDIPLEGAPEVFSDLFTGSSVKFQISKKKSKGMVATRTETQANLICVTAKWRIRGLVRIPYEEEECLRVLNAYSSFMKRRDERIWQLIEERTKDEDFQQKIYEALMIKL